MTLVLLIAALALTAACAVDAIRGGAAAASESIVARRSPAGERLCPGRRPRGPANAGDARSRRVLARRHRRQDGRRTRRRRSSSIRSRLRRSPAVDRAPRHLHHHRCGCRRARSCRRFRQISSQQATLPALAYTSPLEALAERFHSTPALLQQLNPGARVRGGRTDPGAERRAIDRARGEAGAESGGPRGSREGTRSPPRGYLRTPRRAGTEQPNTVAMRPDVTVTVSKAASALTVADAGGRTILYAPVTTGSEHDPLPIGEWKVTRRPVQSDVQLQPRSVLGRRPVARQGEDPAGAEQSGRPGLDRSQQGTLRHPRHAGTVDDRPHRIARLRPADQLGCAQARRPGQARHTVVFTE